MKNLWALSFKISCFSSPTSSICVMSNVGLFQKKPKQEGLRIYIFWKKNPGIFRFVTLPLEIPEKIKFHSCKFFKTHRKFTWFFLDHHSRNSTYFLNDPWNFHSLYFQYSWKFHVVNLPVWIFSGISHLPWLASDRTVAHFSIAATASNFSKLFHL